jgi:hypothetical protein
VHLQLVHRVVLDKPVLFGFPSLFSIDQTTVTMNDLLELQVRLHWFLCIA